MVDTADFLGVIVNWGAPGGPADLYPHGGDGYVGIDDFLAVLRNWGACP